MPALHHPDWSHAFRVAAVSAAVLSLAACGGGDAADPPAPPPPQGSAPAPAPAPAPVAPTPPPVPVITQAPPAQVLIEENTGESISVTLSASATSPDGSALSYQWFRDGNACCGTGTDATVLALPYMVTQGHGIYHVEVRNAAGMTRGADVQVLQRQRSWTDAGTAHAGTERVDLDNENESPYLAFTDGAGRVHVASAVYTPGASNGHSLLIKGASKDSDADAWGYEQRLPLLDGHSQVQAIRMATTWMGHVLMVWTERSSSTEQRNIRAAVYAPGATAAQAGTWHLIGTVNSTNSSDSHEPSVVTSGGGQFMVGWLQRTGMTATRDAFVRVYNVPDTGASWDSGWSTAESIENVSDTLGNLHLVASYPHVLAVFQRFSTTGNVWSHLWRRSGVWDSQPQPLGLTGITTYKVHSAVSNSGLGALAVAEAGNGRVHVRRVNFGNASFEDNNWGYRANAYGSAPVMLAGEDGRIDIFGVSVNTNAGNPSVLAHWNYAPNVGWSSGTILHSNSADFAQGHGLRAPAVVRDQSGNLVLSIAEGTGGATPAHQIKAMRYSAFSAAWTPLLTVADSATAGHFQSRPSLAVTPHGRATIAWGESANGTSSAEGTVRHARLR
jgi:hypothetical protein